VAKADLTLDAGVLIQLEKGNRAAWARLGEARGRHRRVVTVPVAALAQAWRGGGHPNLIRALRGCELEAMSPELARQAGSLCGLAGTSDVVDAAVMASAANRGDTVLTTDYDDLARLAEVVPTVRVIAI
jgi:hypothetical protein